MGLQLSTALVALGMSLATPAMAQVAPGQTAVLRKIDGLSTAKGDAQVEAVMASCLAFGAQPEVMKLMLAEAGWVLLAEYSDEYIAYFSPAADQTSPLVELGLEAQTCGVSAEGFGFDAAQTMAKALLDQWSISVTTTTEGEPPEACVKHEGKVSMPAEGTVYLSVLDASGEETSCAPSQDNSLTTFAFVPT